MLVLDEPVLVLGLVPYGSALVGLFAEGEVVVPWPLMPPIPGMLVDPLDD